MGAELFTFRISVRRVNLNTNEPASLQPSFVANKTVFLADGKDGSLSLRLDLPVKASLMDEGLVRIP